MRIVRGGPLAASMVENECNAVRDIPNARWDWLPGGGDEMAVELLLGVRDLHRFGSG